MALKSDSLRILSQIAKFMGPTWGPMNLAIRDTMSSCSVRDIMAITRFIRIPLVKKPKNSDIFRRIYVFGLHFLFDLFLQRNLSISWHMQIDILFNGRVPQYIQCAASVVALGKVSEMASPDDHVILKKFVTVHKMWNGRRLFNIYFRILQHQISVSVYYDQTKLGCAYTSWN